MLKRQAFRTVLRERLAAGDLPWLVRRALAYGHLKAERVFRSGRAPGPLMAVLMLTENCNLRCPMCGLPERFKADPVEVDTAAWMGVIDELRSIGAAAIGITGGEPTLRADLCALIRHARARGFPLTLNTNAVALNDARIREIALAGPTNINISFDSGRADVADALRGGRNVLARVGESVRRFVALRSLAPRPYTVTLVTVLSDDNVGDLDALFQQAAATGADQIGFMPLHAVREGRCRVARPRQDVSGLAARLRALSARHALPIENSGTYLDDLEPVMTGRRKMLVRCNAGYTTLLIGPDLTLYRCWPLLETRAPQYRWAPAAEHLKAVWNGRTLRRDRIEALSCRECLWNCHAELSYLIRM